MDDDVRWFWVDPNQLESLIRYNRVFLFRSTEMYYLEFQLLVVEAQRYLVLERVVQVPQEENFLFESHVHFYLNENTGHVRVFRTVYY